MITPLFRLLATATLGLAVLPAVHAARVVPDVPSLEQRRATLQNAERLTNPPEAAPLPTELPSPFSPDGFGTSDGADVRRVEGGERPAEPALPQTDREVLEAVAARIPTTGTIVMGGKPLLISGTNRIEVGSLFTVVYNGLEYELELVAINRTTFTVRYKGEQFTRAIKQAKSP